MRNDNWIKIHSLMVGIFFLLCSPSSILAGNITNVMITATMATQSSVTPNEGALFVYFDVPHDAPACGQGGNAYRYAIKGTDTQLISQALLAFASGKTVSVTGTGGCEAWNDTESVLYMFVNQ